MLKDTVFIEQALRCAFLCNITILKYYYFIGACNRSHSMCNYENGFIFYKSGKSRLNQCFIFNIK